MARHYRVAEFLGTYRIETLTTERLLSAQYWDWSAILVEDLVFILGSVGASMSDDLARTLMQHSGPAKFRTHADAESVIAQLVILNA